MRALGCPGTPSQFSSLKGLFVSSTSPSFFPAAVYRTAAPSGSTTARKQRDDEDVRLAWMKRQKRNYRWSQNGELQTSQLCLKVPMLMGLPGPGSETGTSGAPVSGRSSDRCSNITRPFGHLLLRLLIGAWRSACEVVTRHRTPLLPGAEIKNSDPDPRHRSERCTFPERLQQYFTCTDWKMCRVPAGQGSVTVAAHCCEQE